MNKKMMKLTTLSAGALVSVSLFGAAIAHAAPGGNNAGGVGAAAADIAALEAQVDALDAQVNALGAALDALGPQTVAVDCDANGPGALQVAVDAAPAAGASITISGLCGATVIAGKQNVSLSGGFVGDGNGMLGLSIDASANVSLAGLTVYDPGTELPLDVTGGSSVYVADVDVTGAANVQMSSTIEQRGGTFSVAGELRGVTGAQVRINNGSLGGFVLSRSASLLLTAFDGPQTIDVFGNMGVFSGSHLLAQSGDQGSITLSDPTGAFFVQRNAAALFAGDGTAIDVTALIVRQNSVLDVIGLTEAGFGVANGTLTTGGGARVIFSDSTGPYTFQCDDSAWTDVFAECAP